MGGQVKEITDRKLWESFVAAHPEANFLQSWQFGQFHLSRPRHVVRRGVFDGETVVAVYQGVVETARRGTSLVVAGGPIIGLNQKKAAALIAQDMHDQGKLYGCVFVRIRPQLEKSPQSLKFFEAVGFKKAPMSLSVEHAGIIDLTKSEQEVLAGMRQRLRRALRKAEKAGIEVETSDDPASIHEFYQIQLETAQRQHFVPFGEAFWRKQFEAFAETGNVLLYTARYKGEVLAQNFIVFYGQEASYHYGVSTELGTRLSGAPLLHMAAMREARRRGCTRYNFWGIVDEDATKHRYYGVSVFKRGFGVDEFRYVPAHDLIIDPLRYKLTWLIETAQRKQRHV